MRGRAVAALVMVLGMAVWFASPAHAKGENGKVTISGPGVASPIVLRHEDAFLWFDDSGVWEAKWPDPVVAGRMRPSIELGTAYVVRARFGPECPGLIHQTLYPFAEGGPQVLMPVDQHLCWGEALLDGYFVPSYELMNALIANGLPSRTITSAVEPDAAAVRASSGGTGGVASAVAAVIAFGTGGALLVRRRRRHTASRG
jgi:hypothetical protein